jgi:hypothetical protein
MIDSTVHIATTFSPDEPMTSMVAMAAAVV